MTRVQELLADRYELLDELGRGGMGVVYRARDRVLDRIVAVKVLPLDRAQDPTFVARFEREALAAAALNHPNIVAVFDLGTDGDTRFIVMEYISGRSLAQLVRDDGPVGVDEMVRIGVQIADALAAAHRAGIVHRDIKPANVMLDEHGRVKVLDFGIARVLAGVTLTQTAMVLGSTAYLAPELITGERADAASDIYSLGCVLYELLAGRPPFTGELPAAILHQHNTAPPRALRELNQSVPPGLDMLILRMLAKDPSTRPQDAGKLASALSARGAGDAAAAAATAATVPLARGATARPARTLVMPAAPGPTGAAGRRAGAPAKRFPARAVALMAILVVIGVVLALLEASGGPTAASASHHGRKSGQSAARHSATTRHSSTTKPSSSTRQSSTTTQPATPTTVASAVTALNNLIAHDTQAGTVDQEAANAILGDAQSILAAYQQGQTGAGLAGLGVKLGTDISNGVVHGDIGGSAIPALNTAVANLYSVLEQSVGGVTTPTYSTTGPPPGSHGGGAQQPPGQQKKDHAGKHQGQGDQGNGD